MMDENKYICEKDEFSNNPDTNWIVWFSIRGDFHRVLIATFTNEEDAKNYCHWRNSTQY